MAAVAIKDLSYYYDNAFKALNPQMTKALKDNDSLRQEQEKVANDTYNKAVSDTKVAYEDSYRENAIQKLINENEIAEDMASMGLDNSGLNRTQQTAVQLSYANNKSSIDRQRQAQLDSFAQSLAAEISSIKQTHLTNKSNIENQYSQLAMSEANAARNADIDAETKRQDRYYSYLEKQAENQVEPFILKWNGVSKINDSGEEIRVYTDSSGKKYEAKVGYNPYTDDDNAGSKRASTYGFFKNGYQPKGIVDIDGTDYGELDNTGIPSYLTGKKQNVWSSTDKNGIEHFWLWHGSENAYIELVYDSQKGGYVTTTNKVYF